MMLRVADKTKTVIHQDKYMNKRMMELTRKEASLEPTLSAFGISLHIL